MSKVSKDQMLEICHIFHRGARGVTGEKRRMGDNNANKQWQQRGVCEAIPKVCDAFTTARRKVEATNPVPFHSVINCQLVCVPNVSISPLKLYKFKGKKEKVKIEYHSVIVAGIFCPTSNIQRNLLAEEIRLQPKSLHTK